MATPKQFRRRGRWFLILGTLLAALTVGAVMAFASSSAGGTIDWTGQGFDNGTLNGPQCGESHDFANMTPPAGVTADNYLVWVLSGKNLNPVDVVSATLHIGSDTLTWTYPDTGTDPATISQGSNIKFLTKGYANLAALLAAGDVYVTYTGTVPDGTDLKISHGCLGGKAQPKISTTASTGGKTGDTFKDTATLSDGSTSPAITGTITFRLYKVSGTPDCSGTPVYTEDVTVNGNGDYTTATGYKIQTKGTYTWTAEYIPGSDNNNLGFGPTTCGDDSETSTFDASTPDIQTAIHLGSSVGEGTPTVVGGTTHVNLGSTVHDSATATGGPSTPEGTVAFTFYTTIDCTTPEGHPSADAGSSVALVNGVAHPSSDEAALAAGSYSFKAVYTSSNTDKWQSGSESLCEPLTVDKAQLTIVTQIHDANHADVGGSTHVPLGSVVHDTATVTGAVSGFPTGAISFTLNGNSVANDPSADGTATARSVDSAPLGAGSYTYAASVAGNDNYIGDDSGDEPLTVDKAQLTIVTHIHNAAHQDITNTNVAVNSIVHDTASVTGKVGNFDLPGVTFTLNGSPAANANPAEAGFTASTVDSAPLAFGSYVYVATVASNDNYIGATSADEPLGVHTFGKTMGYWHNQNGQARIPNDFNYTLGQVSTTTCSLAVTKANTLTILPGGSGGLNGTSLLTNCASKDAGINANSLNTLLAQTLALKLNIQIINGFDGQTIGSLGGTVPAHQNASCGSLTASSSVQNVLNYANCLIANVKLNNGVVVTQDQIGDLNNLMGQVNKEGA